MASERSVDKEAVPSVLVVWAERDAAALRLQSYKSGEPHVKRQASQTPSSAMASANDFPIEGGCSCKSVCYRLEGAPLFVHCCHCTWCQRETGASFALNAIIEADRVIIRT